MTLKITNYNLFKLTSYLPFIWVISLYIFLGTVIINLGHYPIPSLNDPKELGLNFLYYTVWLLYFVFMVGSILWVITLIIGINQKSYSKKHLIIFTVGFALCLAQIVLDPGLVIYWFID
jgi:uncharacterized membrane protein